MPTARQTCWRVWPPMRAANAWGLTTMEYNSTRDSGVSVLSAEAITRGISADGGLFVPENVPWLSYEEIRKLADNDYVTRAADIIGRFLTDFTPGELMECISRAYTRDKFETDSITPLYEMEKGVYMLELWHGPTCAFKDMALQLLPHLLTVARRKTGESGTVVILVATSGDTGKAALEGFQDVEGTRVVVFYPENGVSPMQKLQMTTQRGNNVSVCAIRGNFDDAQNGVKAVFADPELARRLARAGMAFSSANSINWGRLVPQIVYYVSAYCDLVKNERISCGEHVNIVVPTGNFGNILAAYYAKKMGIPVNKLICASNANHVLTDFIRTGVYDRNRPFYTTISPSMSRWRACATPAAMRWTRRSAAAWASFSGPGAATTAAPARPSGKSIVPIPMCATRTPPWPSVSTSSIGGRRAMPLRPSLPPPPAPSNLRPTCWRPSRAVRRRGGAGNCSTVSAA